MKDQLISILRPESPLEKEFFSSEAFIEGLQWGEPRKGHPEGAVYKHIVDVFNNIDKLDLSLEKRQTLRAIALIHDSFKYKEVIDKPRDWSKHHAFYATQFLAQYTRDDAILSIVKWHDEAYYCWRSIQQKRDAIMCQERLNKLYNNIRENIQLYYLFFICDTLTGDKNKAPIYWFETKFEAHITPIDHDIFKEK